MKWMILALLALAQPVFAGENSSSLNAADAWSQPGLRTSNTQCGAYTTCLNRYGQPIGRISCAVYGYQWLMSRGYPVPAMNACEWFVQPYASVHCAGFQQVRDPYSGMYIWAWQNYDFACPGY